MAVLGAAAEFEEAGLVVGNLDVVDGRVLVSAEGEEGDVDGRDAVIGLQASGDFMVGDGWLFEHGERNNEV